MEISQNLKKAVDSKDVRLTRIMLGDSMIIDPTFRKFDAMLQYAEKELSNLYDDHDGEKFSYDITTWDETLLNSQMVKSVYNFSKERIAFLKQICRHIYADRIQKKEREDFIAAHKPITTKQVGKGVAVGGAVAAGVAILTSHPLVAAAGAVAAVAGCVLYHENK